MVDEVETAVPEELTQYKCERCGFEYKKVFDYAPFLCYRCIRYIAKKTYTIMHTIQPSLSTPDKTEV